MALAMVDHGYILLRCGVGGLGGGGSGTVALAMVGHGYILLRCRVGGLGGGGGVALWLLPWLAMDTFC